MLPAVANLSHTRSKLPHITIRLFPLLLLWNCCYWNHWFHLAKSTGSRRHRFCQEDRLGQEDALEEEMATRSRILPWEIPWTEEPGRLSSMRLQRVRHEWMTEHKALIPPSRVPPRLPVNQNELEAKTRELWWCVYKVQPPNREEDGERWKVNLERLMIPNTLKKKIFFWSKVALHCCVSLCYVAKWISYTYT